MRSLFLLLTMTIALASNAQEVSGLAKDAQGTPLNGATITLFKAKDTSVVKLSVTKEGNYSFTDIKEIVVTAKKPTIEVKADKTILNVEGTINATGSTALELLRKSPGVTVDKDDNLSLSGKNGVQVYIEGLPRPLSGQDLANYLKSMNSAEIDAIA